MIHSQQQKQQSLAGVVVESVLITAGIGLGSRIALDSLKTMFPFLVVP